MSNQPTQSQRDDLAEGVLLAIAEIPRGPGCVHVIKVSDEDLEVIESALLRLLPRKYQRSRSWGRR